MQRERGEEDARSPLEALAMLFLLSHSEAAFALAGLGPRLPVGNPIRGMPIQRIRSSVRQATSAESGVAPAVEPRAASRGQLLRGRSRGRGQLLRGISPSTVSRKRPVSLDLETQPDVDASLDEMNLDGDTDASAALDAQQDEEQLTTTTTTEIYIGVIGAGPCGMTAAAIARTRGYRVTVLEKQGDVGGDWLRWGNPWSKLQIHRDAYLLRSPAHLHVHGQDRLPIFPTRGQMLEYFRRYAQETFIYGDIIFNARVTSRNGTTLFYEKDGENKSITFTHVYAAPGRVNTRSELFFDSEDNFQGRIACGSGGDLVGVDLRGKRVVIVGHGSFAIENARHALEAGAAGVVMIARHEVLIYPRAVSYAIDWGRFSNKPYVIKAIKKMYAVAGYSESETEAIASPPFLTMPPTNDVFFLAIAAGKLKVVQGEVAKLQEHSVETKEGKTFPADVFIKCLGFKRDTRLDAELSEPGSGNMEERWMMNFVDDEWRVYVGSFSNLECNFFPNAVPPAREAGNFFRAVDGDQHTWRDYPSPGQWQEPSEFLADVRKEWKNYCRSFGVDIPYPYTEADIDWMFHNKTSNETSLHLL